MDESNLISTSLLTAGEMGSLKFLLYTCFLNFNPHHLTAIKNMYLQQYSLIKPNSSSVLL